MTKLKVLPVLLASLASLPLHADVGRSDQSAQKQITVDLKTCAKPVWPKESLRQEQQGTVTLQFLIGLEGQVLESKVQKSSGFPLLDLAAQDGLAKCSFTPPPSVGRTEPTWMKMQYVWTLRDSKTSKQQQAEWEKDKALAAQGDAAALYRVSAVYAVGRASVPRDREQATQLLRQSAELGHAPAQEALGFLLTAGKNMPRNVEEGRQWTEKAAAQGAPGAQVALGMQLLSGRAAPEDEVRGRALLEKAAAQDSPIAKGLLGAWLMHKGGDAAQGIKLVEEAADKQDRMAQFVLAEALEKGELLAQDLPRARGLYQRAAAAGFPPAVRAMERLKAAGVD